ncbi:MAG TPA: TonB family protein [Pyrinomonadaceae bacterium]|nr:TonB family protein [Pyrinomonadaceae bacterium]
MSRTQKAVLFSALVCILSLGQAHAQVRLSSDEAEKLLIEQPTAVYPEIAKATRAKGLVRVETIVSDQGVVTSAKAISGHPLLQSAAVNAVKKRKYQPYVVGGKQVPFITIADGLFPPGALTKEQKQEYERQEQLAKQYFQGRDKCRNLTKGEDWNEAEKVCSAVVEIADQLSDDRSLEKMGANESLGHVLVRQKRYSEAIGHYNRALNAVGTTLTERDAELGRLYGDLAIAHHLMRDLDKAREFYKKAEKIFQLAYVSIGDGDSDEFVEIMKQDYMKALRNLLDYHLRAAQDAGAISEAEEIRKLMKSLPSK